MKVDTIICCGKHFSSSDCSTSNVEIGLYNYVDFISFRNENYLRNIIESYICLVIRPVDEAVME